MKALDRIPMRRGELEAADAWETAMELRVESDEEPRDIAAAVRWCAAETRLLQFLVDSEHSSHYYELNEAVRTNSGRN